jgi:hypothetical protein
MLVTDLLANSYVTRVFFDARRAVLPGRLNRGLRVSGWRSGASPKECAKRNQQDSKPAHSVRVARIGLPVNAR